MKFGEAKRVLIFNNRKRLTLIAHSLNEAAKYSCKLKVGNVSKACTGPLMSAGTYYFRYINPNVEIDLSDLGTLDLEEYDKLCGEERPIYHTQKMNRKNWKYTKKSENENQSI